MVKEWDLPLQVRLLAPGLGLGDLGGFGLDALYMRRRFGGLDRYPW